MWPSLSSSDVQFGSRFFLFYTVTHSTRTDWPKTKKLVDNSLGHKICERTTQPLLDKTAKKDISCDMLSKRSSVALFLPLSCTLSPPVGDIFYRLLSKITNPMLCQKYPLSIFLKMSPLCSLFSINWQFLIEIGCSNLHSPDIVTIRLHRFFVWAST